MNENWKTSTHSTGGGNCVEAAGPWVTSTYSDLNGDCVEVAAGPVVRVRDTKDRTRGIMGLGAQAWDMFLTDVVKQAQL